MNNNERNKRTAPAGLVERRVTHISNRGCQACKHHHVKGYLESAICLAGNQDAMDHWFSTNRLKMKLDDLDSMVCFLGRNSI